MAAEIFTAPFFLNVNISLLFIRSSPRNMRMTVFLVRATGSSAATLSPSTPSDIQSTARALAKAISMHMMLLFFSGRHRIIAGSMESVIYGPSGE